MQLVIAAITTEPCRSRARHAVELGRRPRSAARLAPPSAPPPSPSQPADRRRRAASARPWPAARPGSSARKLALHVARARTRSCGRRGPARLGSTVPRSSSSVSEYSASGVPAVWNSPCSFMYASTSAICSARPAGERAGSRASRWSTGKMPQVAPYSGAMLAIVARSASGRLARPGPKNSTNLPTTPFCAQHLGDGQHQVGRGRALAAARRCSRKPTTCGISIDDRLAEHRRLGLDAADAPAEHARGR